jgi:hypothetical protein
MAVCAIDALTSDPVPALPLTYRSMGFQGKVASSEELTRSNLDVATMLICDWQELADLIDGATEKSGAIPYTMQSRSCIHGLNRDKWDTHWFLHSRSLHHQPILDHLIF